MSNSLRVLVVEDEALLVLFIEDILGELGHRVAGTATTLADAETLARDVDCDVAMLDVGIGGHHIDPVVDILRSRGIPYVYASGSECASAEGMPSIRKPYGSADVERALLRACSQRRTERPI